MMCIGIAAGAALLAALAVGCAETAKPTDASPADVGESADAGLDASKDASQESPDGGCPACTVPEKIAAPTWLRSFAIDTKGGALIWTSLDNPDSSQAHLVRLDLTTGKETVLATGLDNAAGVVVDGDAMYVAILSNQDSLMSGSIERRPLLAPSLPKTIATGLATPYNLVVSDQRVFFLQWTTATGTPAGLCSVQKLGGAWDVHAAVEAAGSTFLGKDAVFAADHHSLFRLPLPGAGSAGEVVLSTKGVVWGIAVDDTGLFLGRGSQIVRFNLDGSGEKLIASVDSSGESVMTSDATGIYWIDSAAASRLRFLPHGSTQPVDLEKGLPPPIAIHLDATHVYWGTSTGIFRRPRVQ